LSYFELFLTGAVDAALAAQNAVSALESIGLGCCYIGAMRNKPEEVAKELNLPPNASPSSAWLSAFPIRPPTCRR
jgi:nitroreductase